jgi:hypothetical protein
LQAIDFQRIHMIFFIIMESNFETGKIMKLDLERAVPKIILGPITLRLPNKPGIMTRE